MPGPELGVRLYADTGELASDLGRAAHIAQKELLKIAAAGTAIGTIAARGILSSAESLKNFVLESVKTRAALDDLVDKTGDSIRTLDGLRRQAIISGTGFEQMESALTKLAKSLHSTEGARAFEALGLSADELRSQKPADALLAVARAMGEFADGAGKAAIAQTLFGKAGADLLPFLKDLAEAGELSGRVTAEQAVQAERLEKEWRKLNLALKDGKDYIADAAIPVMADFAEEIEKTVRRVGVLGAIWMFTRDLFTRGVFIGTAGKNLQALIEEIDELETKRKKFEARGDLGLAASVQATIASKRSYAEYLGLMRAQELRGQAIDVPEPTGMPKKQLAAPITLDKEALRELELYQSALQGLEEQLGKLDGMSKADEVIRRLTEGSWKAIKGTGRQAALIAVAGDIDDMRRAALEREQLVKWLENEKTVRDAAKASLDDLTAAYGLETDQLAYERSLLGVTAREQEQLNAVRKVELDLKRSLARLPRDENNEILPGAIDAMNEMFRAAERQKAIILGFIGARQAAERDWLLGAKVAFNDYVQMVEKTGAQTASLIGNAFQHAEDALVQFVRTGKLSFSSLADSILSDLARIAIRQGITGPLAEGLGGAMAGGLGAALGSMFGGGFAKGIDVVPRDMLALVHKGERIVPAEENRRARQSAAMLSGPSHLALAPRGGPSHAGLVVRPPTPPAGAGIHVPSYATGTPYVPRTGLAMLHQGERVVPAAENVGGGGMVVHNTFNIHAPNADKAGLQRLEQMIRGLAGDVSAISINSVRAHLAARGYPFP